MKWPAIASATFIFLFFGVPIAVMVAMKKAPTLTELGIPEECGDCNRLGCRGCFVSIKEKGGLGK